MNKTILLAAALTGPLLLASLPRPLQVQEGAAVPAVTCKDVTGAAFDLASLRGKTVCLVFHDAATRYSDSAIDDLTRGFTEDRELAPLATIVLVLSGTEPQPAEVDTLREAGFDVRVLRPSDRQIQDRFSVVAFPTAFVVDPRGNVASIVRGYSFRFAFRTLEACLHAAGLAAAEHHALASGRTVDADTARALRLASRLLRSGDEKSALRALKRPLDEGAQASPVLLAALTHVSLLAGDAAAARGWLDGLQATDASSPRTRVLAARLALAEGRHHDADDILLELGRTGPESSLLHGLLAESREEWRQAAEAYREALEEQLFLTVPRPSED